MLKINLISEKTKKANKKKRLYNLMKKISRLSILVTVIIAVILQISIIIIKNNFNQVAAQTKLLTKEVDSFGTQIKEINDSLNSIEQIQNEFIFWSKLIEELAKVINDNITLYQIKISNNGSISIRGIATTRDSLLSLKKGLDVSSLFSGVDLPRSSLLEKNNITFEISFNFEVDSFK